MPSSGADRQARRSAVPVRGLAKGTGPPESRPETLLRTFHHYTLIRFEVVVSEQVKHTMEKQKRELVLKAPVGGILPPSGRL